MKIPCGCHVGFWRGLTMRLALAANFTNIFDALHPELSDEA